MIKFSTLSIFGLVISSLAFAQSPAKVTQAAEWSSLYATLNLSPKMALVVDGNFRFVGQFQSQQHQLRAGVEFKIARNLSIVPIGYSYILNYRYGKQPAAFANNEYRFYQQVVYTHSARKLSFSHRVRMEERFIEFRKQVSGNEIEYDGFSNRQFRVRYKASVSMPLTSTENSSYFYLNVWGELHYGWGSKLFYYAPNQNRAFAGVGYQVNKSTAVQGGFIYQWLEKDNGRQCENNVGIMVQLNYAVNLYKTVNR